jgi:hypothetical protein
VQGGTTESRPVMHGLRSTVRAGVELDLKKQISNPVKIKRFKWFQIPLNFDCFNRTFLGSKNLKKYGFEDLGEMNNFLHRNISRFGMV